MNPRNRRKAALRTLLEPIERLLQVNVALIIAQAIIVRLAMALARQTAAEPDLRIVGGILATSVVAGVLVFALSRVIRRFPSRTIRVLLAVGTLLVQAAAFQLLHAYVS